MWVLKATSRAALLLLLLFLFTTLPKCFRAWAFPRSGVLGLALEAEPCFCSPVWPPEGRAPRVGNTSGFIKKRKKRVDAFEVERLQSSPTRPNTPPRVERPLPHFLMDAMSHRVSLWRRGTGSSPWLRVVSVTSPRRSCGRRTSTGEEDFLIFDLHFNSAPPSTGQSDLLLDVWASNSLMEISERGRGRKREEGGGRPRHRSPHVVLKTSTTRPDPHQTHGGPVWN